MGPSFGKLLVGIGLTIAAVGLLLMAGSRWKWLRLGRLPGDIAIERDGFSLFIPITTMILLSVLFTAVMWVVGMLRR